LLLRDAKDFMIRSTQFVVLVALITLACFGFSAQSSHSQTKIDFNRDIRPILSDKCFACHGPDATAKKLTRFDSETAAAKVIVPGKPEQSKLIKRITHKDESLRMPPVESGRTLTPREIELLTEWVRQGANWQSHWAFIPPTRPAPPQVKNKAWVKNPIDAFVLARLEREGLQPSPEADRATLLRRASFDLTGLPPTLQELDSFLNDESPNAYERVVDRLLSSPRYGERMAFKWLDAARYADTNGYQNDGDRTMWRWRDWVIEAFNQNKPYNEFAIEQLGGDLLPNPTLDQRIATAFNRNHRINSEDGLVPAEYAVEYVVDRVDTVSTVFLGLTIGCARCHSHKYDPISHNEYYQLYAYFNNVRGESGRGAYHNTEPWIDAPTKTQQEQLRALDAKIAATEKQLQTQITRQQNAWRKWQATLSGSAVQQWFPNDNLLMRHALDAGSAVEIVSDLKRGESAAYEAAKTMATAKPEPPGYRNGAPQMIESPTGQGAAFDGKVFVDAGKIANFDYQDRLTEFRDTFSISAWFYADSENAGAIVTRMQDNAAEKDGNIPKNRGYGLFMLDGKLHWNAVSAYPDDAWRVETAEKIAPQQWHHVVAIFDGRESHERAEIYVDGRKQTLKINLNRIFRTFSDGNARLRIGAGAGPEYRFKGKLDEVRVYRARLTPEQIAVLSCADSLAKIVAVPEANRTPGQRLKLLHAWLDTAAPPATQQAWKQSRELHIQRLNLVREFPVLMVMEEEPAARDAFLLRRGAYDMPGEKVARALPAALCNTKETPTPTNRLEFANWLFRPENPLTARVAVNRFWQQFFGTGLVKTVEDFGSQGELPSHPELLDWLAVEFMNADWGLGITDSNPKSKIQNPKWDVKALLKTLVMSATYRQSSAFNPKSRIQNPKLDDSDNRLYSRGPRYRLPAEMIRDQALFVSGLLVEKLGGPSVKPYQPEGLFKDMVFSNMTGYAQAKDEGLWRRSLYTYWKRTVLTPNMHVFDATAREACTVRDTRTNTPLQALNLMNDVTYIEAARMLAERILHANESAESRLASAFRAVASRQPDASERQVLLDHWQAQLTFFRANPKEAEKLLAIGEKRNDPKLNPAELAAYATTASLILNLDEVITKQ
jgi:Protein of unknown function (DUF1549)/Protein of unknown function (DUF1553)/Concanavalin A-like lectin/glucanases superfamily/Planctomycete cytochrome C